MIMPSLLCNYKAEYLITRLQEVLLYFHLGAVILTILAVSIVPCVCLLILAVKRLSGKCFIGIRHFIYIEEYNIQICFCNTCWKMNNDKIQNRECQNCRTKHYDTLAQLRVCHIHTQTYSHASCTYHFTTFILSLPLAKQSTLATASFRYHSIVRASFALVAIYSTLWYDTL